MIRRMLMRIAIWLAAIAAAVLPAHAEPRPGAVAGLDLSSPQAGAESFIRAWLDQDYFIAWLAMDPQKRIQFQYRLEAFDYPFLFGDADLANTWTQYASFVTESQSPEQLSGLVIDAFAQFGGMMHLARTRHSLPLTFSPTTADDLKAEAPDGLLARVHIAPAAGGGTLVLRKSPGGLWRLLGLEGRDLPGFWLYEEPSEEKDD